jgi:hypothetical protein
MPDDTQADVLRRQATDGEHQNAEWLNQRVSRRSSPDTSKAPRSIGACGLA